jgi:deazaflavin-dependent oxidoreductase (nitroreductase family)
VAGERLLDAELAATVECRLVTTGRTSGEPRQIRIWFASVDDRLYLLSQAGAKAHWVRNIEAEPGVSVRIRNRTFGGRARVVRPDEPEDGLARQLWGAKYGTKRFEKFLRDALPVAVDLEAEVPS